MVGAASGGSTRTMTGTSRGCAPGQVCAMRARSRNAELATAKNIAVAATIITPRPLCGFCGGRTSLTSFGASAMDQSYHRRWLDRWPGLLTRDDGQLCEIPCNQPRHESC